MMVMAEKFLLTLPDALLDALKKESKKRGYLTAQAFVRELLRDQIMETKE